ncbi:MAG: glycosyltransferase [Desulfobacterales bacterium]|jgi:hypothetical protein
MVARCVDYEFEDIICETDNVDLIGTVPKFWLPVGKSLVFRLWHHISPKFAFLNPGLQTFRLRKDYDLFIAMCMNPWDLLYLNAIKGWRKRCQTAICWIDEIWSRALPYLKNLLPVLSSFDYICTCCSGTVQSLQNLIQRPCFFIPPGIDAIRFCPYPNSPDRSIDVMNIGRRSPVTHNAFLKMAEQNRIFYIYDTIHSTLLFPEDHQQHRQLLANMAKRSRYFLVNTPKIDRDIETNGQNEIGFRFFEGAASGAIMIGQPPDNQAFKEHFDWPDAVIPMGFDEPDVAKILKKLDSEPERLAAIRRNGIVQSLLRHDWAYRWRAILDIVGLEPQPALVARERRLKQLAELAKNTPDFPFS